MAGVQERRGRGAGLLAIACLVGCTSATSGAESSFQRFVCAGGESFGLNLTSRAATVQFGASTYNLQKKPSSLGERYTDRRATLIIDNNFAAFVTDDNMSLRDCRLVTDPALAPSASAAKE
jgi:hypothetical protein